MRILIETDSETAPELISELEGVKIIDQYEPLERLSSRVEKVGITLKEYKSSGIDWDVFRYYMKGKGFSMREVDGVMAGAEEFFKRMGVLS